MLDDYLDKKEFEETRICRVSPEDATKLFTELDFLIRLEVASNIAKDRRHRSGFEIAKVTYDPEQAFLFGNVVDHQQTIFEDDQVLFGLLDGFSKSIPYLSELKHVSEVVLGYLGSTIPVVEFHQRPAGQSSMPTFDDVTRMIISREDLYFRGDFDERINCNPIYAIGSFPDLPWNKNIEVLLMQQATAKPIAIENDDAIYESIRLNTSELDGHLYLDKFSNDQSRIALSKLKAEVVTYEWNGATYKLAKDDHTKIAKFSSNPTLIAPVGFYQKQADAQKDGLSNTTVGLYNLIGKKVTL